MKSVLGSFIILLVLGTSAYAETSYRCQCVGAVTSSGKFYGCGNGHLGGGAGQVETDISSSKLKYFMTADSVEKLLATGDVQYCKTSGWQCEPE